MAMSGFGFGPQAQSLAECATALASLRPVGMS
jgi:hypothetical protein